MSLGKRLKAFFKRKDESVSLDLIAADIRNGRALLQPRNERDITYMVRSDDIEIHLSKGRSLGGDDIVVIQPVQEKQEKDVPVKETQHSSGHHSGRRSSSSTSIRTEPYGLGAIQKEKNLCVAISGGI